MHKTTKLKQFAELATLPGVLEKPAPQAGHWTEQFGNTLPIVLELGCGYGEYTIALAQRYPKRNYIGIDIQGERLWRAAKTAQTLGLKNVRWLRIEIEHLFEHFGPQEVNEIWITFPDPFPRLGKAKKRLTSPRFLKIYQTILQPAGLVHLKTDVADLVAYSRETIQAYGATIVHDMINLPVNVIQFDLDIMTRFELKHRQRLEPIYYLSWYW